MDRPLMPRLRKPFPDKGTRGPLMRGQLGAITTTGEQAAVVIAERRQGSSAPCIGPNVASTDGFHAGDNGYKPGRAVFEADGIALVIGAQAGQRRTPFAILFVTSGPHLYTRVKVALEGWIIHAREDEQLRRLGAIAERLVELRSGGWHLHEHHRVRVPGPSVHVHSGSLHHPLTDQLAYGLPDVLSPRPRRAFAQIAAIERALQDLPDSPLMLVGHERRADRLDGWSEYFATDFDRLARMAIARYPDLPVTEAVALAEAAQTDPHVTDDPAGAIDRAQRALTAPAAPARHLHR